MSADPSAPPTGVAGLVLAAGEGRRLGRPKALVEVDGRRLVDHAVDVLVAGGAGPLVVVSGAVHLDVPRAVVVPNPDWSTGLGSSLRAGLTALAELPASEVSAVVITLVDQPGIGASVVGRLLSTPAEAGAVIVAAYRGHPRNPVLLPRLHWDEAARLAEGDIGARPFLQAHPELVQLVECGDIGDPADIDEPADLARWIAP